MVNKSNFSKKNLKRIISISMKNMLRKLKNNRKINKIINSPSNTCAGPGSKAEETLSAYTFRTEFSLLMNSTSKTRL